MEILKNNIHKCLSEARSPDFENLEKLIEALIDLSPAKELPEDGEER